ncbi:MAG TPA: acetate/propionate family kinase [Candidatus Aquilonibacter sp.]|nr:acetate/propionate family kinase [Candidatus Aquilonibacter sp.]
MAVLMPGSGEDLILAVNSGSSSLKIGLFQEINGQETAILKGAANGVGKSNGRLSIADVHGRVLHDESYTLPSQTHALSEVIRGLQKFAPATPVCVGHRVVHGGPRLRRHQRVTEDLLKKLHAAVHFAPLHIPTALALIKETGRILPEAVQYACFDTAFHAHMPESSRRFALPDELYDKGIERYGFHGLSYESIVQRLGARVPSRMICAHLGSGASLVAVREGVSIDTSMGLTPTGGIPMATRCGDLDPGVLIFLMRTETLDADGFEKLVNHESGLLALADGESDMQRLEARAKQGDRKAETAIDIFATAVRKFIGAYAAELGGLDLLVFTGGIGEHSQYVRERICRGLEFLGIARSAEEERAKVIVMTSEEEVQIARHCRQLSSAARKSL